MRTETARRRKSSWNFWKQSILTCLLPLIVILGVTASATIAAEQGSGTVSLVLKLVSGLSPVEQSAVVNRHGGVEISSVPALRLHVVEVPADNLSIRLEDIQADPQVERVELNKTRKAEAVPVDPDYSLQWALSKIGWESAFGSVIPTSTATIALLDTGIDASHQDLAGKVIAGVSILDGSYGLLDPNGHGTWMAGIASAVTDNGAGIAGVGYAGVQLMPVTVLNAAGIGQDSDIIAGILWAVDNGADVILMGFSNPDFSQNLQDAIDYAWEQGVVLVAATGNDGVGSPTFPAGDRSVIGVSATDQNDALDSASNFGQSVFLAAPGVDIYTTGLGHSYRYISGTSASSAIVAGVAAFMKAVDPELSNGIIVGRLARTADLAGALEETGNGRINMANALADTSTEAIQPAGAYPVGSGGPYVGPYAAAATNTKTTVVLTDGDNPSVYGSSLTFTATVRESSGKDPALITSGDVRFIEGTCDSPTGMLQAATPLNTAGQVSFTTTTLPPSASPRIIVACYDGYGTSGSRINKSFGSIQQMIAAKLDQETLTVTGLPASATYGQAGITAGTSGGSGDGAVSFSAGTSDACTVDASTGAVTIISGSGTCSITATKAADATYNAATSAPVSIAIEPAIPVITWADPSPITVGTALSATQLNATVDGVEGIFVYDPADGIVLDAGDGQILKVTFTPTDSINYAEVSKTVQINVTAKLDQETLTVTGLPASATYGQAGITAGTLGGSGTGAVSFSAGSSDACTVDASTGAVTIISGSGTCSITATKAADSTYNAATSAPVSIAISPATSTLECSIPASLTVPTTHTASSLTVTWGASTPDGVTYKLERSSNGGETFTMVYSGIAQSYTVTNLVNGSYVFRVKAVKSGLADSLYQTAEPCVVTLTAGEPPSITVPATDFDGSFIVNWGASPTSGVSYLLEQASGEGGFTEVYSGTNRSYAASGLASGSFVFRVKAVKSGYVDSEYQTAAPCVVTVTVVEAPGALSVPATDTDGTFAVSWSASETAGVTYKLERSADDGATFTQVYSGTGVKYTASNLATGSYTFRLKAVKSGYVDSTPQEATCAVTLTAVDAPASINVPETDTDGTFTVSWDASAMADVIYKLERSLDGVAFLQVYSGTAQSYAVSGLTNGSYVFRVKAVKAGYLDSATKEAPCDVTLTAVGAPGAITAPATDTDGAFTVSWDASATSGVTYKLERSTNGGAFLQVYSGPDQTYEVSGQGNGSYAFRVKAVKEGYVDSAYQTANPCVVTLTVEALPSITVPATSTTSSITVSWAASATAGVTYKLERSDDGGETYSQIYSGAALSFPINGLTDGSYTFQVKAVKTGYVESGYQTATCVVTLPVVDAPASISVPETDFDGIFPVSWGPSATIGVTYKLERSDDGGETYSQIYSGTGLSYTVSGLTDGNYTFQVKAVKSGSTDSAYVSKSCEVTLTVVAAPASFDAPATDTDGTFPVSWGTSATDEVTYKLERAVNGEGFTLVYSGTEQTYTASGLSNGTYEFRVKAVKSGYVDSTPLSATCEVTVTAADAPASIIVPETSTTGSVAVSWEASPMNGVTYRLERSFNNGMFTQVYSGTELAYEASGLSNGSYKFQVKAVKSGYADSEYISGTCVVTVSAVAMPPSITAPATDGDGAFTVSWEPSTTEGVTYKLERSLNGAIFTQVYSGSAQSYVASGLSSGSYVFRVKATKAGYPDSDYQTAEAPCVVALTAGTPPSLNVPATDFDGSFAVNWTASATSGVTYKLERSDDNGATYAEVYSGTNRSYVASGLGSGSYLIRVKAVKAGYLDSPWQTAAACTVTLTAVGTPPSITVPATDADGSFMVSWGASATSGVTYKLERSNDGGVTFISTPLMYSGTSKAYTVNGLSNGSYMFRVKAVKTGYVESDYTYSQVCVVTIP